MQTLMQNTWDGCINIRQNNYRTKAISGIKEGHYVIIKGSIHQEDITLNVQTTKCTKQQKKYLKQKLVKLKREN